MSLPGPVSGYTKDNPFPAKMKERRVLSAPGSGKEAMHIVFDLKGSGLVYEAGDAVGIFGENHPDEVEEVIGLLGMTGEEEVMPLGFKLPAAVTLRRALRVKLVLSKPTGKFVRLLLEKATDEGERKRLEELLEESEEGKARLGAYLKEREFVDLLAEFPKAAKGFKAQEFVECLRRLMPRLYSISSSPKMHPGEVHVTLSVVRYSSNGRERHGVCSTHMADRVELGKTETRLFIAHSHFALPEDGTKDVIMVGPGVGIAPFHGFLEDRVASGAKGRNWLFFGDRQEKLDFLYKDELENYLKTGGLAKLTLAWSRDQAQKIYVQDRIRENGAEFWQWVKNGACFYVCGDAKHMAKDVDLALNEVIMKEGGMSAADAATYLRQMKNEGRYKRDVY